MSKSSKGCSNLVSSGLFLKLNFYPIELKVVNCLYGVIKSLKPECLSHLMLFSKKQLELAVREYVQFYNTQRPHQGLDNEIPIPPKFIGNGEIVCKERLGGLLKSYERQVA
jgi:hypothetical protein